MSVCSGTTVDLTLTREIGETLEIKYCLPFRVREKGGQSVATIGYTFFLVLK